MCDNDNLKRLNQISSTVSEVDLKIWENVAHCICIKEHTDKLKGEIERLKNQMEDTAMEKKIIDDQLTEVDQTLDVQATTLKATQNSIIFQTAYKESLQQEINEFRQKYADALDMCNEELADLKRTYEETSPSYKELKKLKVEMKKLEINNMTMDVKIQDLMKNRQLYNVIQKTKFHKTFVKLAEYCKLYHKMQYFKKEAHIKKQEEQQLLKEHFRLTEAVKQKRNNQLKKCTKTQAAQISKNEDDKETFSNEDKIRKFLNDEMPSCNLNASFVANPTFNENKNKVKILDMKLMLPPKPILKKSVEPELKKKFEDIIQSALAATSKDSKKNVVTQDNTELQSPLSLNTSPEIKEVEVRETLEAHKLSQETKKQSQETKKQFQKMPHEMRVQNEPQRNLKRLSQENQSLSQMKELFARVSQKQEDKVAAAASSILKSSQTEKLEKVEKQESISKFFDPRKKSVTFLNTAEEGNKFQLFEHPTKKTDIFRKPFQFKSDRVPDEMSKKETFFLAGESEVETYEETTGNCSFSIETANGSTSVDTRNDFTFNFLDNSSGALSPADTGAVEDTNMVFDFFGSQTKNNNPFNFF